VREALPAAATTSTLCSFARRRAETTSGTLLGESIEESNSNERLITWAPWSTA
jgi:hypothetical protein